MYAVEINERGVRTRVSGEDLDETLERAKTIHVERAQAQLAEWYLRAKAQYEEAKAAVEGMEPTDPNTPVEPETLI